MKITLSESHRSSSVSGKLLTMFGTFWRKVMQLSFNAVWAVVVE
jgi:hypothetical protein